MSVNTSGGYNSEIHRRNVHFTHNRKIVHIFQHHKIYFLKCSGCIFKKIRPINDYKALHFMISIDVTIKACLYTLVDGHIL